jgi:hypothetical protein
VVSLSVYGLSVAPLLRQADVYPVDLRQQDTNHPGGCELEPAGASCSSVYRCVGLARSSAGEYESFELPELPLLLVLDKNRRGLKLLARKKPVPRERCRILRVACLCKREAYPSQVPEICQSHARTRTHRQKRTGR